jgi:hypothetical protein
MATYRVTLIVEWPAGGPLPLPLDPVRVARLDDERGEVTFEVAADDFDNAAGRLWGEMAACGLHVLLVEPERPLAAPAH